MFQRFLVYGVVDGLIKRWGTCSPSTLEHQAIFNEALLLLPEDGEDDFDPAVQHVVDGRIVGRPFLGSLAVDKTEIVADGVDVATISGLPAGSMCNVGGDLVRVDDGVLEVSSEVEQEIVVLVDAPPHQVASVVITAVAPG